MEAKWPQATTTRLKNVFGREVRKKMNEEKNLSGKNRSGRDRRKLFNVYLLDDQGAYHLADQGNEKRSATERRDKGEKRNC